MNRNFLFPLLAALITACAGSSTINIRKNPTTDFSLKEKPAVVVMLPSRNYSEFHEIDLPTLDKTIHSKLRSKFPKGRFIPINQLKSNILNGQDVEVVDNFIKAFKKSGMFRANTVTDVNEILKVKYYLAPSFGANIGAGYSSEWIFTLSMQIYDGSTGKTAFSVTAENTEDSVEGFEMQKSDFFESVIDSVVDAIP